MSNEKKNIKIVNGDGKDLKISDVDTHISSLKPKTKTKNEKGSKIVIPKVDYNKKND